MAIDWTSVGKNVTAAVEKVVGPVLKGAPDSVVAKFAALVAIGRSIEQDAAANPPRITKDQYDALKLNQQRAIDTALQGYAAIGAAVAQQAAAAAWGVVESALKASLPFAI